MKIWIILSILLSSWILSAAVLFTGSDQLTNPSVWPVGAYETLQVALDFNLGELDGREVYCELVSPSGCSIGLYATEIDEEGLAFFSFATAMLWHCGESGCYTLCNLRILTPEGFACIEGAYQTRDYMLSQFPPDCQSSLLSCDNGVEIQLREEVLQLDFHCPEESGSLPRFLFDDGTIFDGYAVAIDSLLEDISFGEDSQETFTTATYTAYDATAEAIEFLATQGDGDVNLEGGEALSLQVPIRWNGLEYGAEKPEEFVYLVFFYHSANQEFVDSEAIVVHSFDCNRNLQISKSELDAGLELWVKGEVSPQFLLEAIPLCDATTYEYDDFSGRFFPYWP